MIAVVQRVLRASVRIHTVIHSRISHGLMILLGVEKGDTKEDAAYLVNKIIELRIFNDENGKMNRSLMEIGGAILVVSQFTLLGDTRKGRRPSFNRAADAGDGESLYDTFIEMARTYHVQVETGVFGAMMEVDLVNDGPVTILVESRK